MCKEKKRKEYACATGENFKFPIAMSQVQSIQIEIPRRVVKHGNLFLTEQTFTSNDVSIYFISVS